MAWRSVVRRGGNGAMSTWALHRRSPWWACRLWHRLPAVAYCDSHAGSCDHFDRAGVQPAERLALQHHRRRRLVVVQPVRGATHVGHDLLLERGGRRGVGGAPLVARRRQLLLRPRREPGWWQNGEQATRMRCVCAGCVATGGSSSLAADGRCNAGRPLLDDHRRERPCGRRAVQCWTVGHDPSDAARARRVAHLLGEMLILRRHERLHVAKGG